MLYRQHNPSDPLSTFVACLWYSEGLQGVHKQERLLPNGESGIVIDLREHPVHIYDADNLDSFETYAPAIFCGSRTDCFVINTSEQARVIGIQFKPGGALPFLGMPASEVAHATHALEDLWGNEASLVREQLLFAANVDCMFRILEQALLTRYCKWFGKSNGSLHPAVNFAIDQLVCPAPAIRTTDLAERIGLSSRRFIEVFRHQTGLTPKAFQRVRRFQQVLGALRAKSSDPWLNHCRVDHGWADLALNCGYYDQAHFIHDFREFSGMTPGEYVKIATPHLNHLPID